MLFKLYLYTCVFLILAKSTISQTVEMYAGNERAGVDLMWFKYVKNKANQSTRFLFFSRNRANTGFKTNSALIGSTNAISYNFKHGIGLVLVGSFVNTSFTGKAGVQLYKQHKDLLFFGWLVADIKRAGNIDLFGMLRYSPSISEKWKVFSQLELFPVYQPMFGIWNITERIRIGAKTAAWSVGWMLDVNQHTLNEKQAKLNTGIFIRHDF